MAANVAKLAFLRKRIRRIAADAPQGFSPRRPSAGLGTRPTLIDTKSESIVSAATSLDLALQRIVSCVNFIESPIQTALKSAIASANKLGDPQLVQKAQAKFQRIFGEMFSALDVIKSHLAPIIAETTAVSEESKVLDKASARQLIESLRSALPMISAGFKTIDPAGHESAIEAEIQKQSHFLRQIKQVLTSKGTENPETQKKLQLASEGATYYLNALQTLADPEYADRVKQNMHRALNEHLPKVIEAAKALAKEFGAVEKAASIRQIQKRLHMTTKRIVLLAYLRDKSS